MADEDHVLRPVDVQDAAYGGGRPGRGTPSSGSQPSTAGSSGRANAVRTAAGKSSIHSPVRSCSRRSGSTPTSASVRSWAVWTALGSGEVNHAARVGRRPEDRSAQTSSYAGRVEVPLGRRHPADRERPSVTDEVEHVGSPRQ